MTENIKRNLRNLLAALVAMSVALFVLVFIPFIVDATFEREAESRVERRIKAASIVIEWGANRWETADNGAVSFDVYGVKMRQECIFIADWRVSALATVSGKYQEAAVEFLRDVSPGSTRPPGAQFFGRWRVTPPDGETIEPGEIQVMTAHDCGTGRPLVVASGPFEYPGQSQANGE